jgi:acyl carrier protein
MPEHMVPAEVVFMEAFPHTPNQKIDRKALPALESGSAACDAGFDPPTSDVEKALADLWRHLLGVERIGRSDNFFELGGHSLMAMQLVSRVRDQFDADLPLKNLFEHPTLAGLAEVIEALTWSSNGDKPAPAFAVAEREEVVL